MRIKSTRDERATDRAVRLAETTSIICARRYPTQQAHFHLAHPSGGKTICGMAPHQWSVVQKTMSAKDTRRVCESCVARAERMYGHPVAAEEIVTDFNAFMATES